MRLSTIALAALSLLGSCATQATSPLTIGWAELARRDYGSALASFDAALSQRESAEAWAGRARVLHLLHEETQAAAAYERAIELQPRCAQWHVGLSVVHLAGGDAAAAMRSCDRALAFQPGLAKAYYNRALAQ